METARRTRVVTCIHLWGPDNNTRTPTVVDLIIHSPLHPFIDLSLPLSAKSETSVKSTDFRPIEACFVIAVSWTAPTLRPVARVRVIIVQDRKQYYGNIQLYEGRLTA